jgi:hypothetical protein
MQRIGLLVQSANETKGIPYKRNDTDFRTVLQ